MHALFECVSENADSLILVCNRVRPVLMDDCIKSGPARSASRSVGVDGRQTRAYLVPETIADRLSSSSELRCLALCATGSLNHSSEASANQKRVFRIRIYEKADIR